MGYKIDHFKQLLGYNIYCIVIGVLRYTLYIYGSITPVLLLFNC